MADNGGEPIRTDTLDRFVDAFACCGFRRETLCPCYGLAEATLWSRRTGSIGFPRAILDAAALAKQQVVAAEPGLGRHSVARRLWPVRLDDALVIADPDTHTTAPPAGSARFGLPGPRSASWLLGPARRDRSALSAPFLTDTRRGAVPPHRRPGLPPGRRVVRHRAPQGPHRSSAAATIIPRTSSRPCSPFIPALRRGCGAAFEVNKDGQPSW